MIHKIYRGFKYTSVSVRRGIKCGEAERRVDLL